MAQSAFWEEKGKEGIVANWASDALKQIRLPFGVKDELRKLERTITAIKAVLLDAEEKKAINNQVKVRLDSLEDVLYDADKLIDEFHYQQLRRKVLFGKKKAKKGWWGTERQDFDEAVEPSFPSLSELVISACPLLTSMPLFPNLEKLKLYITSSKSLEVTMKMKLKGDTSVAATSSVPSSSSSPSALSKLKDLEIVKIGDLESLPEEIHNLSLLQSLSIEVCSNFASLPEGISNLKSLQKLRISNCPNLTSLPEGITNLKSLQILGIADCNKLSSLPEGISNLKSLQELYIYDCPNLTSLPEDIRSLPFLKYYA